MKKSFSLLLTSLFFGCVLVAHSTVLRVNNTPGINVPYATLTVAYNAAVNGDTIYLEGTTYDYGTLAIYKRLVIIGTGYYLSQNPETQANKNSSSVTTLYFYAGSSGSKVMGVNITSTFYIAATLQDLIVQRNYIGSLYNAASVSNSYFEQNMIFTATGQFLTTLFRNNFMNNSSLTSTNNTLFMYNNVFNNASFIMAECKNNIMYGSGTFTNCNMFNNIGSITQFPTGNGNQQNVNMNNVFLCFTGCGAYAPDAAFQLKVGSPAIGAGSNGEDCGMFGGTDPYILSGMPPIPAIYYFNYNFNNSTINVDMKVKSHN